MRTTRNLCPVSWQRLALFALIGASGHALSAGNEGEPVNILLNWNLSLDATGKITTLTPVDKDYQPALSEQIAPLIRAWHFTPGKLDGRPAPTATTLRVALVLEEGKDNKYDVRIVWAETGPVYKHVTRPKYHRALSV